MNYHVKIVIIFLVTSVLLHDARANFFTSIVALSKLLLTEGEIAESLEKYIKYEEEKLEKIKWLSKQFAEFHEEVNKHADNFLMNPVNAYILLKRLTTDWETLIDLVTEQSSKNFIFDVISKRLSFPTVEDLSGTAESLRRLQEIYLVDTSTIALGKIDGTSLSAKLTAGDCFELGRQAYQAKELKHTLRWMNEALNRLDDEIENTANKTEIVEYMAFSAFVLKNYTYAVELNEYLLELNPHHIIAHENLMHCKKLKAKEEEIFKGNFSEENETVISSDSKLNLPLYPNVVKTYKKLCRGEKVKSSKEESQLYCFYSTNNNSYLLLQPAKAEILNFRPRVVVYHNVLKDWEADIIKLIAAPKLVRDRVSHATSGVNVLSSNRISMSAGISDDEHNLIPKINQRVEDITGLTLDTSEILDVINYGIGGHYSPHLDYALPEDKIPFLRIKRNRIATWIFYLSHVPAGGSTVFPAIGVEVKPEKGAAVLWYNLKKNGDGDTDTLHSACPVLVGSKWVANKWIHEAGNEFIRKCSLDSFE